MSGSRQIWADRPFDVVVVVGSLGALTSFQVMLEEMGPDFPAAVIFDLHHATRSDILTEILRRRTALQVTAARRDEPPQAGTVHVAPHDRQLVLTAERRFDLLDSGTGPGHRHADGVLLSAAEAFGPAVIAVVLSGRLQGGARGVRGVKLRGGRVLVEDPESAAARAMPDAALATGCVDFVAGPAALGHALLTLCAVPGAADLVRVRVNSSQIT